MAEYIERKIATNVIGNIDTSHPYDDKGDIVEQAIGLIDHIPAADVAPVRHGRWERIGIKGRKALPIYPCCSACGIVSAAYRSEWEGLQGPWKYCPNCGCKMDGDTE